MIYYLTIYYLQFVGAILGNQLLDGLHTGSSIVAVLWGIHAVVHKFVDRRRCHMHAGIGRSIVDEHLARSLVLTIFFIGYPAIGKGYGQ